VSLSEVGWGAREVAFEMALRFMDVVPQWAAGWGMSFMIAGGGTRDGEGGLAACR